MTRVTSFSAAALAFLSFVAVALAQAWPLPLHMTTRFTGSPAGDTGVYLWNTWVFRHELVAHGHSPLSTDTILALDGPADLSLHNYTVFSNLLALPLQPWIGVAAAFNVVYVVNVALTALGLFLLARRIWADSTSGGAEAWLAAVLFAASPFLVARSTAHFSLVAAAPLPFFVLCFERAWNSRRTRDAAAAGACIAWAAHCDAYYAVYCVLLGIGLIAMRTILVTRASRTSDTRRFLPALDLPIVLIACATLVIHIFGGGRIQFGALAISLQSLYTPVLLLTVLVTIRVWRTLTPTVRWTAPSTSLIVPALVMTTVAAILLSPLLYAMLMRALEGRMVTAPVLWRSSAPGVDLVTWLLPNPNHPLAPDTIVRWLQAQPGQYEENVSSIPWTAMAVIVLGWRWMGRGPHRAWMTMALAFAWLALGPFVRIAGINTFIPTPWTLLRYLPIIGDARMPSRFSILVIMAVAIVFTGALAAIVRRHARHRTAILALVAAALTFELLPVPRLLYSADIPPVFATIGQDPRPLRVLNLPFGIRDGLSSLGDFNASSLYFQTGHGKTLIGGYLSRISEWRKDRHRAHPVVAALMAKSEGRTLTDDQREAMRRTAGDFVREARIGWVVVDDRRTPGELHQLAVEALQLVRVEQRGAFVLYVPKQQPEP